MGLTTFGLSPTSRNFAQHHDAARLPQYAMADAAKDAGGEGAETQGGGEVVFFAAKKKNRGNLRKRDTGGDEDVRAFTELLNAQSPLKCVSMHRTDRKEHQNTAGRLLNAPHPLKTVSYFLQGDDGETNVSRAVKAKKETAIGASTKGDKAFSSFAFESNKERQEITDNGATATKETETSFDRRDEACATQRLSL